ncbi:DUF2069 domain-containing protein [Salinicola endophyticus]|uniref:DUF2069 domain-containing protein n=1 Tax=Salinicola endophyticus TaxID=1949083 RepID=A0ABY8FJ96_9GAMM|nr:DUF2069 domain-containing protein [Salinicola endophyticus]WFF42889.1 DUF2069 domain-containing protein [Salinicola endophyticus]
MSERPDAEPHGEGPSAASIKASRSVWAAYLVLLALLIVGGLWRYSQAHAEAAALVVRALPLVLFLPTLLLRRRRGHLWLTAVGLLYLAQGGLIMANGGSSPLVIAEMLAAAALAVSAFRYFRRQGPRQRRPS